MKGASKKSGKYLKAAPVKKRKHRAKHGVLLAILPVIVLLFSVILWFTQHQSIYRTVVRNGYTGTQEQLLASLVGEEVDEDVESAYTLAVENGYKGSEAEWIDAFVGVPMEPTGATTYRLVCENGFEGSLTEWLTQITDDPENLGRSKDGKQKTEYELACEYGYTGTFIDWLVSVTHDRVFK